MRQQVYIIHSMKKQLFVLLTLLIFFPGCNNVQREFEYSYPQIPSIIQDDVLRRAYLAEHYWDKVPWDDTTITISNDKLRKHFYEYLTLINETGLSQANILLNDLASKASSAPYSFTEPFLILFDESLNHPNSPMRHEGLYKSVVDIYIENLPEDSSIREKLKWERELLVKNSVGKIAEDFNILFEDGGVIKLHKIESELTLIYFFEPDCNSCKEGVSLAESNDAFSRFKKRHSVIAVYTGEDIRSYEMVAGSFPAGWKTGRDINNEVTVNRLYDRRASPSIYLLDKDKRVLIKDGDVESVIKYLEEIVK